MVLTGLVFAPYVVTLCAFASRPVFSFARKLRNSSWSARNDASRCGRCNKVFDDLNTMHLFEGHYVCGTCAESLRRNVVASFTGWGLLAASAVAGVIGVLYDGYILHDAWALAHMAIPALVAAVAIPWISYRSMRRLVTSNAKELADASQHSSIDIR